MELAAPVTRPVGHPGDGQFRVVGLVDALLGQEGGCCAQVGRAGAPALLAVVDQGPQRLPRSRRFPIDELTDATDFVFADDLSGEFEELIGGLTLDAGSARFFLSGGAQFRDEVDNYNASAGVRWRW